MRSQSRTFSGPFTGIAVVAVLLIAWLGQVAIVAAHTHQTTSPVPVCQGGCHGAAAHDERESPEAPDSPRDEKCQVCLMATLASGIGAFPLPPHPTLLSMKTRITIGSDLWIAPTLEVCGLYDSRGPPAQA